MEKPFINHIFIDLRGRDFKGPNRWFVSPRGASRDAGTDVSRISAPVLELEEITSPRPFIPLYCFFLFLFFSFFFCGKGI